MHQKEKKLVLSLFHTKISSKSPQIPQKKLSFLLEPEADSFPKMSNMDIDLLKQKLTPENDPPLRIGTNIVSRNPDIEVAALTLKDIPLTETSFQELSKSADWYRFSFLTMQVGPPGFSTVPYSSTRKKDEKPIAGLNLYESVQDNKTRVYPYMKGKTNKDRGVRVKEMPCEDVTGDDKATGTVEASVTIKPGMCFAHFMRRDIEFDRGGKFFVDAIEDLNDRKVLPAFSIVYFQISSSNVDQASNGRILKVRRMKIASEPSAVIAKSLPLLPTSEGEFKEVNECSYENNWGMRENMDKGTTRLFTLKPSKNAFMTEEDNSVLVGANENVEEALCTPTALSLVLPSATRTERLKFLNIAIVCGAVNMLVRTNNSDGMVMDCSGEAFVHKVVAIHVDTNKMLGLQDLSEIDLDKFNGDVGFYTHNESKMMIAMDENSFLWGRDSDRVTYNGKMRRIIYSLKLSSEENGVGAGSMRLLDKGCNGNYMPLQIMLMKEEETNNLSDVASIQAACSMVMTLELRPENQSLCGSKRKRMSLCLG